MRCRKLFLLFVFGYLLFIHPLQIYAAYMLPYPSTMPGNKIYKITRIVDNLKAYWYFGDIAQAKYHLLLSDKYLVEAKTLFEYKQYLLGQDALLRSDSQFSLLEESITRIETNNKNATDVKRTVSEAADTHIALLNMLQTVTPEVFDWTPEKGEATHIPLYELYSNAKDLRMRVKVFSEK